MDLTTIRVEISGRVATVWLDRPHRHNAWTGRLHTELRSVMFDLEQNQAIRAVVITGTGTAFCVGGDSEALAQHAERGSYDPGLAADAAKPGMRMQPEFDDDMAWMYAYRTPIIAAVNGAAAGIGLAFALFCDLRFGAAGAKLTTAAPKLGLPAEYGTSWVLPRLIGVTRAADLLLSGRTVTVADTADWGLWNDVLPDGEQALAAALEYARTLTTTTGAEAVSVAKSQLYRDLIRPDVGASVAESRQLIDEAMRTDDYREGIAAFIERRPPNF
ncbi:MAG TPA: enoyl-CoA hydratase-related protein [Ilumatobacter sp.]|nr:enoyl-CoA hydratase-related protein [Ilumatobacter sp.]